jgi:hypothetical protein
MMRTARLQITEEQLVHLKLCEMPQDMHFDEDVLQIAQHIDVDPTRLAQVLREK